MIDNIFFSIITCTFNSQKFIKGNLDSVSRQSYQNLEHIFIDGFSKDKTMEMIRKYKQEAKYKVRIFQYQPTGISCAMNLGIRQAKGKFLIHLHSDDNFYDKDVLSEVHSFLKNNTQLDWIYGKINSIDEQNQFLGVFPESILLQQSFGYILKFFNFIPHQAVFIKKDVFTKYGGFDEDNPMTMDYDLWLRIRNKTKWRFFNRIISNYRMHKGAMSSSQNNRKEGVKLRKLVQRKYANSIEYLFVSLVNAWVDFNSNNNYA